MNRKILYTILLTFSLLVLFRGLGYEILYAKTGLKRWIPFLIIIFLIPFTISRLLKIFNVNGKANLAYSLGSVLLIGPLFGIWVGHLSETELIDNGIETIGVVSEKRWSDPRKRSGEWLLKCDFVVNRKVYKTFSKEDKDNLYKIGDTLTILYSRNYPDNSIVVELE